MKWRVEILVTGALILMGFQICLAGILGTKHDLSVTGGGTIRAVSEDEVCVFCHTPHGATSELPLWNHQLSTAFYTLPDTTGWPALLTTVQQPDKGSRLCLSCHDGTVAIGALVNMPGPGSFSSVTMQGVGGGGVMPVTAYGYIGTDLSGMHPISIAVNQTLINAKNACNTGNTHLLQFPDSSPDVKLKPTGNTYNGELGRARTTLGGYSYNEGVQCATCHDPHNNNTDFLVMTGIGTGPPNPPGGHGSSNWSALCTTCHFQTCP